MKYWRVLFPILLSGTLLAWVLRQVPPGDLAAAAVKLPWQLLLAATLATVLILYLWDAVCLRVLFSTDGSRLGYWRMLRIRGSAYLLGAFNSELGKAAMSWNVAKLQGTTFLSPLSRMVVLAYHDAIVLFSGALAGASVSNAPQAGRYRAISAGVLAVLGGVALVVHFLPTKRRRQLHETRWGAWIGSWSWGRSLRLLALRAAYFGVLGVYLASALRICELQTAEQLEWSKIPLVLLADSVPSVSGLGVRENLLLVLFDPSRQRQGVVVAMSLFWTAGLVFGRGTIGLVNLWLGPPVPREAPGKLPPDGRAGD